jgi:hypothetical protein
MPRRSAALRHISKVSGTPRSHLAPLDSSSASLRSAPSPQGGREQTASTASVYNATAGPQFVLAKAAIVGADHGPNRPIVNRAASTEGSPTALACIASIRARHARAAMSIAP